MLGFALRRLRAQWRMVAAVVVLVGTAATHVGVATLLLGATQERAFSVAVERERPERMEVTAFLVDLSTSDMASVRDEAGALLEDVLGPTRPAVTSQASSRMRDLADLEGLAYLATTDALPERAELVSGRWPRARGAGLIEAVLPDNAARRLDLGVGDRVRLGGEAGMGGVDTEVRVELVGTFRPRARAGWEGDRLAGAGFDPAYSEGTTPAPAYGPFLVDVDSFLATGSTVTGLRVTARPDLGRADDRALRSAVTALRSASARLSSRVGDRVRITRVASELPVTYAGLRAEQSAARSTVLVVLLLGSAMSLAALLLAGRLVAGVRDDERALLVAFGLSPGQQLRTALLEGALVAATATVLAVPVAAVTHSWLTHLPAVRAAGLAQGVLVDGVLVGAAVGAAALMTLALVLPALDLASASAPSRWRRTARSAVDLLLVVLVAAAWWQLRAGPDAAPTGEDAVLTAAPVVFVLGIVLLLVRGLPSLAHLAAETALRSRALVLPLAAVQAARRRQDVAAMLLLASAAAAVTFGTSLHATWERSQEDQADLRVGTDLALTLPAPAVAEEAASVVEVVADHGDPVVSAVAVRPVALGRYLGEPGAPPMLVAVDAGKTGALVRGRLDGRRTWAEVGAGLAADVEVGGMDLPTGLAGIELTGDIAGDHKITVRPTAVVQDAAGFRSAVDAEPVPVDGAPHPVRWRGEPGPGRLVALRLQVHQAPTDDAGSDESVELHVSLSAPSGGPGTGTSEWEIRPLDQQSPVGGASVSVDRSETGAVLHARMQLDPRYLAYTGADLLATAFDAPGVVPVAVSQKLADDVGAEVGGSISATVGRTVLPLEVTAVVPAIPAAPGAAAVLADLDTVSRALVRAGQLDAFVDGWWVAGPTPAAEAALRDLDVGEVTTRDETADALARGPMRATVPAVLLVLVVTAALLLLAGTGLLVGGDRGRRAHEAARLRALGLARRDVRRLLLAEHTAMVVPLVVVGALAGAVTSVVIGPTLVRSDLGGAPVPEAVLVWPWAAELLLTGGLLLACTVVVWAVTAGDVRRSDPAGLRTAAS